MSYRKKQNEIAASTQLRKEVHEDVTKEEKQREKKHCLRCMRVTVVFGTLYIYAAMFLVFVYVFW